MTLVSTKRILAVLLLLCMVFGLLPASAFAEGDLTAEPVIEEAAEAVEEEDFEPVGEIADLQAEAAMIGADILPQDATTFRLYLDKNCPNSPTVSSETDNIPAGTTVNLSKYSIDRPPVDINKDGSYFEHYEIISWNTAADGSGVSYERGGSFVMPESDMTLYAIWEVTEQKHWEVVIDGSGTLKHHPFVATPNGNDYRYVSPPAVLKIYVQDSGSFWNGRLQDVIPIPDDGYIFDDWYLYGDTELNLTTLDHLYLKASNLVLTDADIEAGRNKIVAKFVENNGDWVSVTYRESADGEVYYQQMVKKGEPMPTIDDPIRTNSYFLGWDQEVAATVTDNVVYTAQWLDGPESSNVVLELFTIRCVSGEGEDGSLHSDLIWTNFGGNYTRNNDDIAYDQERGIYTCSLTVRPEVLNLGTMNYDEIVGQEHSLKESSPIVKLVWNPDTALWEPDGEQIVEVTHKNNCVIEFVDDAGFLPTQTVLVRPGSKYPSYDFSDPSITNEALRNVENQEPIKLGDHWYRFLGWTPLKFPWNSVTEDTTFHAMWEELKTVTFTDGLDGEAFETVEFPVSEGDPVPYSEAEDLLEWEYVNIFKGFDAMNEPLESGEYFCGWNSELPSKDSVVTEDLVFTAMWDTRIAVLYYDGFGEEIAEWGDYMNEVDYYYYAKTGKFPDLADGAGIPFKPERDDFLFSGWKAVQDPEASGSYLDGNTGYLVNVYRDEDDDEAPADYEIILVAQWAGEDEYVEAAYASLNLDGTIGVNFEMRIPAILLESDSARAVFIYKGEETQIDFHSMKHDADNYFVFTYRVPAREFANTIGLKFVDGNTIVPMFYSNGKPVKDNTLFYSGEKYTHSSALSPEGRALAQAVQNYCFYAYQYLPKDGNQEPQMFDTPDVSTVTASMLDPYKLNLDGQVTGLTITSYYLTLQSSTNVNLDLSLAEGHSIEEYTFTLDGKPITPTLKDGSYVLVISSISARRLDTPYDIVITHGTEVYSIRVFGLSFARTVLNNSDYDSSTALRNLCKAVYLYSEAANVYFGD